MPRPLSIALVIIGAILLAFALMSSDSVSSGFSKLFHGTPDTRTIVLLVAGLLALVVGGIASLRSPPAH